MATAKKRARKKKSKRKQRNKTIQVIALITGGIVLWIIGQNIGIFGKTTEQ